MVDETRTDEQFWADFAKAVEKAKQLPEWKRRYRIMIDDEEAQNLVDSFATESQ
jgi:hypothetical protein